MRLPVDTNAGLKKCMYCSNFINGECEAIPIKVIDNRYELIEGVVQEAVKEYVNIPKTVFDAIEDLIPKKYHSKLIEILEGCEPDILSDVANVVMWVLENKFKVEASVSPDINFCCKKWR